MTQVKPHPLSTSEREQFFCEPHIAIMSVNRGMDLAPLSVPVWYYYIPEKEFWISLGSETIKAKILEKVGILSLATQIINPLQYVTVEAKVISAEETTREQGYAISERYIPEVTYAREFAEEVLLAPSSLHTTYHLQAIHWLSRLREM